MHLDEIVRMLKSSPALRVEDGHLEQPPPNPKSPDTRPGVSTDGYEVSQLSEKDRPDVFADCYEFSPISEEESLSECSDDIA
jgi:hypothetical protein